MVSTVYGDYVLHEYYLSLYICRYTGEFLRDQAPLVIKKPDPAEPEVCRRAYMTTAANQFSMKTSGFIVQVHAWYTQMESKLVNNLRFDEGNYINMCECMLFAFNANVCLCSEYVCSSAAANGSHIERCLPRQ